MRARACMCMSTRVRALASVCVRAIKFTASAFLGHRNRCHARLLTFVE